MDKGAVMFAITLLDLPHPGACHRQVIYTEPLSAQLHPPLLPLNTDLLFPGAFAVPIVGNSSLYHLQGQEMRRQLQN